MTKNILVKAKNEDLENIEFIKKYFFDFQGVELQTVTVIKRALKELKTRMEKEYEENAKWHLDNKYDYNNLYIEIDYKNDYLIGFKLDEMHKIPFVFYIIKELINKTKNCRYKNEYINIIQKYMNTLEAYEFEDIDEFEEMEEDEIDQGYSIGKIVLDLSNKTFQYTNLNLPCQEDDLIEMYGDNYLTQFIELNYDLMEKFKLEMINTIINDTKFIKKGYIYKNEIYEIIK